MFQVVEQSHSNFVPVSAYILVDVNSYKPSLSTFNVME